VLTSPACPQFGSEFTDQNGHPLVCLACAHECPAQAEICAAEDARVINQSRGNLLQDGSSVAVIRKLWVKGRSLAVKLGTEVRNHRLVDGDHHIDCKIDGIGALKLTSDFERKARACGDRATCERLPCGGLSLWFSVSLRRISTEKKRPVGASFRDYRQKR
jgi:protein PhnA